jgi:hypothetical protein
VEATAVVGTRSAKHVNIVIFLAVLVKYFEYVARLWYDEDPDYEYCRKLIENGLKDLKCSLQGKLGFSGKGSICMTSLCSRGCVSVLADAVRIWKIGCCV